MCLGPGLRACWIGRGADRGDGPVLGRGGGPVLGRGG